MKPDVWFVVLNWNGRADTLELLDNLCREQVTVLVVDNGSEDGTLDAVRAGHPDVRTIQTGANLGYAGGNNVGIAAALASGAGVIGVLNNDTLVEPGFLTPLLDALADEAPVALSPDIRYADDPELSWFRGGAMDHRSGWPHHLGPDEQPPADSGPVSSQVLTGCCIVAGAATWRRVGSFDDGFYLMFEDSDWSLRATACGIALLVVPRSRIRHKVSRSFTGTAGALGAYYFARNGLVFARRHLGVAAAARFLTRQILRPSLRALLDPQRRRSVLLSYLGVGAALVRQRGPAGRLATVVARRGH